MGSIVTPLNGSLKKGTQVMIKLAVEADVDEQLYELYKKCCHLEHFCVLRRMQQLMNLGSAYLVFFRLLSCLISIVQHFWLSQLLYGLVRNFFVKEGYLSNA